MQMTAPNPYEYQKFLSRPLRAKLPDFERNGRLKHILFAQQFERHHLDHLMELATCIEALCQSSEGAKYLISLLPHKRVMLYFTQTSTRTFLSFAAASQILGMAYGEIRDPKVSSEFKGEHPFDSIRMFSSYYDIVVMRSGQPNFAERCSYLMNEIEIANQRSVPIVNGGSGADEHPTQALLDIFT